MIKDVVGELGQERSTRFLHPPLQVLRSALLCAGAHNSTGMGVCFLIKNRCWYQAQLFHHQTATL